MATLHEAAFALKDAIESRTRESGEQFYSLKDGAPEWVQEAVRAAHDGGDMLPNDWSYRLLSDMAERIFEAFEREEGPDRDDVVMVAADELAENRASDVLDWLCSHSYRVAFTDEAIEELGWPHERSIMAAAGAGMRAELHMIGNALFDAIEGQASPALALTEEEA
jgi:hypothetical protein